MWTLPGGTKSPLWQGLPKASGCDVGKRYFCQLFEISSSPSEPNAQLKNFLITEEIV